MQLFLINQNINKKIKFNSNEISLKNIYALIQTNIKKLEEHIVTLEQILHLKIY